MSRGPHQERGAASTYRLQLRPGFGFGEASRRVGYFRRLGVSHLYLSPVFEAVRGSPHGYDVVDPTRVRDELGGRVGFEALARAAREAGLGVLIDIVPNHMAAHQENGWWWRVLRDGRGSAEASIFDIDWERGNGRVVLPVLGAPLDEVIERGEIRVETSEGASLLRYFDKRFPLHGDGGADEHLQGEELRELLDAQHYELIHWREGGARRNYRRFFDINELVGVRVEDEAVFTRTHGLVRDLWREGLIDGVRVDHIDGLARPGEYLRRLEALLMESGRAERPWIIVEKIPGHGERLPEAWPVSGTTGYERLNAITRMFVTESGLARMEGIARGVGVGDLDFHALVTRSKREVLESLFAGELERLTECVASSLQGSSTASLLEAITEIIVELDVYRTYLADDLDDADSLRRLKQAAERARGRAPEVDSVASVLLGERGGDATRCVRLFEQLSGPAMAKGVEDTAHYRHAVLTALNEVGGEPVVEGADPIGRFHADMREFADGGLTPLSTHDTKRSEDARARILALGEAPELWSELLEGALGASGAREHQAVARLSKRHLVFLLQASIAVWPEREGAPTDIGDRLRDYMIKAAREGKEESSWASPDAAYEQDLEAVCKAIETPDGELGKLIGRVVRKLERRATEISLAQTVLRLTAPGAADSYQGTEVTDRSMVDPDNRRPVHFEALEGRLGRLQEGNLAAARRDLKLHVTRTLLELRRRLPEAFRAGYTPVAVDVPGVVCFVRGEGAERVCAVAGVTSEALSAERVRVPVRGLRREALSGRTFAEADDRGVTVENPWELAPALVLV